MTDPTETNLLARALEVAERKNHEQGIMIGSLTAEVAMLREALERSDTDRIRLQAVSSSIMGGLLAINSVIADQVKLAVKHGVEAVAEAKEDTELEKAASEVADILQRIPERPAPEPAPLRLGSPRAPNAFAGGTPLPPSAGLMRSQR